MRVRTVLTLCDRGDEKEATRVYVTLPEGRFHVDLCEGHIKELKKEWLPDEATSPRRKAGKVATLEQVQAKRGRAAKKS